MVERARLDTSDDPLLPLSIYCDAIDHKSTTLLAGRRWGPLRGTFDPARELRDKELTWSLLGSVWKVKGRAREYSDPAPELLALRGYSSQLGHAYKNAKHFKFV